MVNADIHPFQQFSLGTQRTLDGPHERDGMGHGSVEVNAEGERPGRQRRPYQGVGGQAGSTTIEVDLNSSCLREQLIDEWQRNQSINGNQGFAVINTKPD